MAKRGTKNINATISAFNGIIFKSKLEKYAYIKIKEKLKIEPVYEAKRYILQQPFTLENDIYEGSKTGIKLANKNIRPITYTPDFEFIYNDKYYIVETKGRPNEAFPLRWKMFKKLINENKDTSPIVFMPQNQKQIDEMLQIIKNN